MKISNLAVKRPVTIAMVFLVIILLGAVSLGRLNLDLLPEMDLPMALAMTTYEGVGPEEIENLVTRPIEGAVGTVNGIKNIHATSSMGQSIVFVEFAWGTDMNFAINQMREKIDMISNALPSDATKPMLFKLDPNQMPIMYLGLSGDLDLAALDKLAADTIKPALERVNGVASVEASGGVTREIRISAVPQRLQAYGLSLSQIVSYLASENRNTSAGTVEEGLKEHVVRVTGEFKNIEEIKDLQIPLSSGGYVRLEEIARVEDTYKDKSVFVYMNGKPALQVTVQRQTDANTVKVSDAVLQELEALKKVLPAGVDVKVAFDSADFIRKSISQVASNAVIGALLAVFILLLFLRNMRSTLIIGTAIPISIIATFILMYFGGLTLNLISLGGLALGVGMMVDNAIVILENIYRYRQNGYSRAEAAIEGANEVGMAVIASTLTSVVVFLPMVYVEGMASQIFRPMALTVSFALLASLMVALTLVPMLSSKILRVDRGTNGNGSENGKRGRFRFIRKLSDKWGLVLEALDRKYRGALHWAINNKKKVVFTVLGLLVASLAMIPVVGMEFMPSQDSGEYQISIELPKGTALRETQRVTEIVDQFANELPESEWAFYVVGSGGGMFGSSSAPEQGLIMGKLVPKAERQRSIDQVLDELREKCGSIPGAKIEISAQDGSMGSSTNLIEIGLSGDNLEVLRLLSETIAQRVREVDGTREVKTSLEDGRPEIQIKLNRQKADLYGLNASQVSSFVATAVRGSVATKHRINGEEMDVRVVLDEDYRENLNDLEDLVIMSSGGALVTLGDIADLELSKGPASIARLNQSRRVTITGDISGRDLAGVTKDIQAAIADIPLPQGVQLEFGGANKEMMESFQSLGMALILAVILVYMILAAQFEALLYPFIIMFAVPPTVIGVVLSLLVTGRTLSVPTFIGIIMLAGIVVNNAIVLVGYINTLRRRDGMPRKEAILQAGPTRLRPILMTTLTTVLALLPSAVGIGEGSEMSAPMATAVAGGLSFSTLITLFLVPCMYIIMEDLGQITKRIISWRPFAKKPPQPVNK